MRPEISKKSDKFSIYFNVFANIFVIKFTEKYLLVTLNSTISNNILILSDVIISYRKKKIHRMSSLDNQSDFKYKN